MAMKGNHQVLLKNLKMQVKRLVRKEEKAKKELRAAIKKMRSMSEGYKATIASKVKLLKHKLAEAHASGYVKAATEIERQLIKGVEKKARAVVASAVRLEKKAASKATRKTVKKAKHSRKRKTR